MFQGRLVQVLSGGDYAPGDGSDPLQDGADGVQRIDDPAPVPIVGRGGIFAIRPRRGRAGQDILQLVYREGVIRLQ
ncbi:hypothetical protein D3C74_250160 [compost metagenome]